MDQTADDACIAALMASRDEEEPAVHMNSRERRTERRIADEGRGTIRTSLLADISAALASATSSACEALKMMDDEERDCTPSLPAAHGYRTCQQCLEHSNSVLTEDGIRLYQLPELYERFGNIYDN